MKTVALPHPKDLSAALSHPDQHCPFLAAGRYAPKDEKNKIYPDCLEVFRYPTSDDWAPNFPNEMVEVSFRLIKPPCGHETWLVTIYGRDDIMQGKNFSTREEAAEVIRLFPPFLSFDWLYFHGFSYDNSWRCVICKPEEKYPIRYYHGM